MPQENIQLSIPDMQCSGCEDWISYAIQTELKKTCGVSAKIKINSREKIIDININEQGLPINEELDKNQLTLKIKKAIFTITDKNAYTMGCDLEITEKKPDKLPCIPDKWFLIKPSPPATEWQLFQVDSLGKTKNNIPMSSVPALAAILQEKKFDEDKVRDELFFFQKDSRNKAHAKTIRAYWIRALFSMSLSLVLLIFSVAGVAPLIYLLAGTISAFFTFCIGWDTYYQACRTLYYTKQLTIDSLFTVSTLTILIISLLAVFFPGLNWQPMFEMAPLIFCFKYSGMALVEAQVNKPIVAAKLSDSIPLHYQVDVLKDKHSCKRAVKDLKPGDIILIKPGKRIPVDGEACEDLAVVSTLSNYGDIDPVEKKAGALLHAGMLIEGNHMGASPYKIKVTQTANNSHLMSLDRANNAEQLTFYRGAHTANYIIPLLFLLAIVVGIIVACYFPLLQAIQLSISMLVSFCPCTLGLVDALSSITGTDKLQEKKITIKNSNFFNKIKKNCIIAFDLVGTLTTGKHKVLQVQLNQLIPLPELKNIIYTLEKNKEHSVSRAICEYLEEENREIKKLEKNIQLDLSCHMGVSATIDDFVYYVGNNKMMEKYNISLAEIQNEEKKTGSEPEPVTQVIYIARKKKLTVSKASEIKMSNDKTAGQLEESVTDAGELLGLLKLTDPLRPEVIFTLLQLQTMRKELAIFTGSSQHTLDKYLAILKKNGIEIENTQAECVNSESEKQGIYLTKKEVVTKARLKDDNLMMVGEGENDALVVGEAGIGIAIESDSQSSVTHNKAHLIIPTIDSLLTLFAVTDIKATNEKQNICIVIIFNIIAMMLPMTLMISGFSLFPVISLLTMLVSLILIKANDKRFKRQVIPELPAGVKDPPIENMSTVAQMSRILQAPLLTFQPAVSLTEEAKQEKYKQRKLFFERDFSFRQVDPCLAHSKWAFPFVRTK